MTGEWRPIDTAPKDGTRILLLRRQGIVCGNWNIDQYNRQPRPYWSHDLDCIFSISDARQNPPTLWQPLPPLPATTP